MYWIDLPEGGILMEWSHSHLEDLEM
jgi:hypothetical protein